MEFKDKLKDLRIKNNETQQDLAEKLNISFQSISKWEKGLCLPSIDMIKELAAHYNVTLDYLLLDNNNEQQIKYETYKIEYHPVINKESHFSIFLEKDKLYPSRLAKGRYRTDASHNHRASDDKNSYVIAVNKEGKVIYMALGTGHCMGSPCDPFYHQKEVVETKGLECFHILDTYRPFGDGTDRYQDFEFIIPKDGFVITITNNSYEIRTLFSFLTRASNEQWIDFRRFQFGSLDEFDFKFENDTLTISYTETPVDYLKKTITQQTFDSLFNEYLKKNKKEILNMLKDEIYQNLMNEIEEIKIQAQEAYDLAEEALCTAEDAVCIAEDNSNK